MLIYMHTHAPYHSQLVVHVRPSDEGPAPTPDIVYGTAALTDNPVVYMCMIRYILGYTYSICRSIYESVCVV